MHRAPQRSPCSLAVQAVLLALSLSVPAMALLGLLKQQGTGRTETFSRIATFWEAIPGSLVAALLIGVVVVALVVALSPGTNGAGVTSRTRYAALIVGACLPQIVLVLAAAPLGEILGRAPIFWFFQALAIIPLLSVIAALAIEGRLRVASWTTATLGFSRSRSASVAFRTLGAAPALLVVFAAALAFQNYLINLCLREAPSADALVALSALSPHTGLDWTLVLLASLTLWLIYLVASWALEKLLRIHSLGRR